MDPNIWGPHAWFFLHTVTLCYPENPNEQEKIHYFNFFKSLSNILPCMICRENYKNHFIKFPLKKKLNNKEDINEWLVNIHNEVNKIHKKKQFTYKEFTELYDNIYKKKTEYKNPFSNALEKFENFKNKKNKQNNKKLNISSISITFIVFFIIMSIALNIKFLFKK